MRNTDARLLLASTAGCFYSTSAYLSYFRPHYHTVHTASGLGQSSPPASSSRTTSSGDDKCGPPRPFAFQGIEIWKGRNPRNLLRSGGFFQKGMNCWGRLLGRGRRSSGLESRGAANHSQGLRAEAAGRTLSEQAGKSQSGRLMLPMLFEIQYESRSTKGTLRYRGYLQRNGCTECTCGRVLVTGTVSPADCGSTMQFNARVSHPREMLDARYRTETLYSKPSLSTKLPYQQPR